jgi:hypothetical protein
MKIIAFVVQSTEIKQILAQVGLPVEVPKRIQREGHRKMIYGKARLLANGKSMRDIPMPPIKINRCIGSTGKRK